MRADLIVPHHWVLDRFRHHMRVREGLVDPREEPWSSTVLVAPDHIEKGTGRLLERETAAEQGADSGKATVHAGDIIYSKIRPALNKAAIAVEDCLCSADAYAVVANPTMHREFALYWMLSRPFLDYATVLADRVKMPKINRQELADAPWVAPPLPEQRAIAAYLDRETADIDALVAEQERLIATLRERRAAVVQEAMGDGERRRLRGFVSRSRPLTYGILQCGEPVPDGVPYLGPSDLPGEGAHPDVPSLRKTTREIADGYRRSTLAEGDVVVSIGPAYGRIGVVPPSLAGGNLTQDVVRVALQADVAYGRFVVWALSAASAQAFWDQQITGATFRRLNLGTLGETPIPDLPLDEQRRIADYLDEQTSAIDNLIAETERFIEVSKERRSALITAAVTGQIDCTHLIEEA